MVTPYNYLSCRLAAVHSRHSNQYIKMSSQAEIARARIQQAYHDIGEPVFNAAEFTLIKVFIDHKAFDVIPDEGDIAVSELAAQIGGSEEVVDRICTFFISGKILKSTAPGRVAHTEKSRLYKFDQPTAWLYIHMFNNVFRSFAQMPDYFAKYGLASPQSASVTPLGLAHGYDNRPAYDIIVANKVVHKGFNEALRELGVMYSLKGVYDFSWMQDALASSSRPAIVDVGGSHGLALRDAVTNNRFIPAERCILYDLPQVIENTTKNVEKDQDEALQKVQKVGGSMFEPYPEAVQGALIYQFRRVLNDFPDEDVVRTFQTVRKAVAPDSRILIIEEMLNPKRIPMNVGLDICLMCAAGKRRNAAMFSELAARAGFRLNAEFQSVNGQFDDFGVLEFVVA
ncbi:putative O-methyltransferase [Aspergillus ibericus CBS 121593]|uniref:Putative O-methyltransferase n=1 Tax=Aspergillus ibericus CBS 121593 TaxID=1448316 RepID=A0A395H5V5_9EURO|nr:putative O-methyltransferase [Aspergillus ibericus CBS 121593]RAL02535.1 putative O-methyltransferase [Aspergillus ibericus CBS 121593]